MTVIPTTRDQVPQIMRNALAHGRAPGGAAPAGGLTGQDFLRILRKRIWMIVLSVVITTGVAALATGLWLVYAPWYTAEALLAVTPPKVNPMEPSLYPKEIIDRLTLQQAQMTRSENILEMAIQDENVKNTDWYKEYPVDQIIKRLMEKIDVAPLPNTAMVRISMTGVNGRDMAKIVNAVADAAVRVAGANTNQSRLLEINQLNEEKTNLTSRIGTLRTSINSLMTDVNMASLAAAQQQQMNTKAMYNQEIMTVTRLKAEADQALAMVKDMEEKGQLDQHPEVVQMVEYDGNYRALMNAVLNYQTELDNALRKFGPQNRNVLDLQTRLKSVQDKASEIKVQVTDTAKKAVIWKREGEVQAYQQALVKAREQMMELDTSTRDIATRLTQLTQYEGELKDLDERVKRYDDRIADLRVLARETSPVSMAVQAREPKEPSTPRWAYMIPMGLALGLLVGLGLAFLVELIDTSVKTPSDVSRRVDLPLLGMVPHSDDIEEEIEDLRLAFNTHPTSLIGESFRQIRTCLLFSGPAENRRTLMVSSPLPEDGRTTVALNLGATIAQGGRKVLVIDANFRQPMIRRLFPQCEEPGLSSALVGQGDWRKMVYQIEPNLFVMSSGTMPPNPAELLGSDAMRALLVEMAVEYEQVIFDGPPSLVVTDAAVLSTVVDGVILVVRAGANTFGIVHRARDTIQRVGGRIIGVVLNGVRVTAGGYLRKNYETFYEYHSQARLPVEKPRVVKAQPEKTQA